MRLRIAEDTFKLLDSYNWPGNVRELENTIQRAVALANTDVLLPRDIPLGQGISSKQGELDVHTDPSLVSVTHALERLLNAASEAGVPPLTYMQTELAKYVTDQNGGDAAKASKQLGIKPLALKKLLEGS